MTNEEYINQIIEIGNTLQIHPNSPKGQTLKKCIEVLSAVPKREDSERAEVQAYFDGEAYGWEEGRKALIDELKAEIVALPKTYPFVNHIDTYVKEDDVLQILDNISKESED